MRRAPPRLYRQRPVLAAAVLAALLVAIAKGPCRSPDPVAPPPLSPPLTVVVRSVFDGDTIETAAGETIRLLGIDAPEAGTPFAAESTAFLSELVLGATVRLAFEEETGDRYGRKLAHVFRARDHDEVLVAEELLRRGLACLYLKPPNLGYARRLALAQRRAVEAGAGVWSIPVSPEPWYVVGAYRFHRPSCPAAAEIPQPRKGYDRAGLLKDGKGPCRTCKP